MSNQATGEVSITLVAEGYSNERFEKNMQALKRFNHELYSAMASLKPVNYRLCVNPDGSPNLIHLPTKKLVYPLSQTEITQTESRIVDIIAKRAVASDLMRADFPKNYEYNHPVQADAYKRLHDIAILKPDGPRMPSSLDPDYIPYLRIYGVGLGTHILRALQRKQIYAATIVEPELEIFYASLFVNSWDLIIEHFSKGGRALHIVCSKDPDRIIAAQQRFLRETFNPLINHQHVMIASSKSDTLQRVLRGNKEVDATSYLDEAAGWYDDQKIGLFNALGNLREKRKLYNGKKTKSPFRAFIVGSGPSLDSSIEHIKKNQSNAIIFSCGTAISALLSEDIIPDFYVLQERFWTKDTIAFAERESSLRNIRLMKLNVVSELNDGSFKDTYVFQKYNDPGTQISPEGYPPTQCVNPTVTNSAVAFAAALGASEVFFFGIDYGSVPSSGFMHSKRATFYHAEAANDAAEADNADRVDNFATFSVDGNLCESVKTTSIFAWSRDVTQLVIKQNPHIRWVNVGDGARICGAEPLDPSNFPDIAPPSKSKSTILFEISSCFDSSYDPSSVFKQFRKKHVNDAKEYIESLMPFADSEPSSRDEIIDVLSGLYHAVQGGKQIISYLPRTLYSGGIIRVLEVIFIQATHAASDKQAALYFSEAKLVLRDFLQRAIEDTCFVFEHAISGRQIWLV